MRDGRSQCSQQGPVDAATGGKKAQCGGGWGSSAESPLPSRAFCWLCAQASHLLSPPPVNDMEVWGLRPPAPPLANLVLVPPGEQGTAAVGCGGRQPGCTRVLLIKSEETSCRAISASQDDTPHVSPIFTHILLHLHNGPQFLCLPLKAIRFLPGVWERQWGASAAQQQPEEVVPFASCHSVFIFPCPPLPVPCLAASQSYLTAPSSASCSSP